MPIEHPETPRPTELSPGETELSPANCGQPVDGETLDRELDRDDDELTEVPLGDIVSQALTSAQTMVSGPDANRRPASRSRLLRRRRSGGGYSGARPDELDPAPLSAVVAATAAAQGWLPQLAEGRLMGQWADVVGADIAAHCQPTVLRDGELKVTAESTAWATQLRLMAPQLLARIAAQMPEGLVRRVVITGPSGPSWQRGPWSMRGGRGVRDTYG